MAYMETLTDIPDKDVDTVVNDFESEGAIVAKTRQANGTWTVVATFPDKQAPAPGQKPKVK